MSGAALRRPRKVEHYPYALASDHSEALRAFLAESEDPNAILQKYVSAVLKSIGAQNAL